MLLRTVLRQFNSIFIIFGSILITTVPHVYDFASLLPLYQIVNIFNPILYLVKFLGNGLNPEDIIGNLIKTTPREYQKMPILRIPTLNPIHKLLSLIKDLKLLPNLRQTATINHSFLPHHAHKPLPAPNPNLRPLTKANIPIPHPNIRRMIIIILAGHFPRTMRGGYQQTMDEGDFLFEGEVDVTLVG